MFFSSRYWGITKPKDSSNRDVAKASFNGEGVLVAVLDTGVNPNHEALKGSWSEPSVIRYGRNFFGGEASDYHDNSSTCHGTAVASIVAGTHRLNPDRHVRSRYRGFGSKKLPLGVAPKAHLMICKVCHEGPSESAIVKALQWIHAHNTIAMRLPVDGYKHIESTHKEVCDMCSDGSQRWKISIVNMSFRLFNDNPNIRNCITDLNKQNVICVAGAGNDGNNIEPGYPALYENVLSVGLVDSFGVPSNFSTRHKERVDVYALGEHVLVANTPPLGSSAEDPSAENSRIFERRSGTSFATPAVSGLIAILVQCAREQGGEELAQQITHLDTLKKLMKKHLLHEIPEQPNCNAYLLQPGNVEEFFQQDIKHLNSVLRDLDKSKKTPQKKCEMAKTRGEHKTSDVAQNQTGKGPKNLPRRDVAREEEQESPQPRDEEEQEPLQPRDEEEQDAPQPRDKEEQEPPQRG